MGTEPTPGEDETARPELAELRERRALLADEARPEAVERRHARGGRTARENVADLVDPGSFVEYGALRDRRPARAGASSRSCSSARPPTGWSRGTARINGELFGDRAACAVLSYDYTVLAGTQGALGHRKKDRLFELIERMRLPTVFFAEGGGGRPGDTDYPVVSALDTRAFALWARLSGLVPRIAIVAGRCFAGNAVIAGCSDLIVATEDIVARDGRPGDDRGRRPRRRSTPDEIGPIAMQAPNGVVDVAVADEAEAVAVTKRLLGYFQGAAPSLGGARPGTRCARSCRSAAGAPTTSDRRSRPSPTPARSPSCATRFAREMVTALARIEGRPVGDRSPTTRCSWPARSPATAPTRRRASCSCATPSASRSSR